MKERDNNKNKNECSNTFLPRVRGFKFPKLCLTRIGLQLEEMRDVSHPWTVLLQLIRQLIDNAVHNKAVRKENVSKKTVYLTDMLPVMQTAWKYFKLTEVTKHIVEFKN